MSPPELSDSSPGLENLDLDLELHLKGEDLIGTGTLNYWNRYKAKYKVNMMGWLPVHLRHPHRWMLSLLLNHQQNDLSCLPATTPLLTFSRQHRHQQKHRWQCTWTCVVSSRQVKTVSNFGENTKVISINCIGLRWLCYLFQQQLSAADERVFSHGMADS